MKNASMKACRTRCRRVRVLFINGAIDETKALHYLDGVCGKDFQPTSQYIFENFVL